MDIAQAAQQLFLGLSLASAAGLRAFLPLLAVCLASRFGYVHLNSEFAWLHSMTALIVLAIATVAEVLADKVPVVDHALDTIQTVVRPVAGALAVAGTQSHFDPTTAAVMGLILGAPLAGAFHIAKGSTRLASTATTAGFGNPILSLVEDATSIGISLLAVMAPVLAFVVVLIVFSFGWRVWNKVRRRRKESQV